MGVPSCGDGSVDGYMMFVLDELTEALAGVGFEYATPLLLL